MNAKETLRNKAAWRVVTADCTAYLPGMAPNSVDAIITDPPYGTNDGRGKRCGLGNTGDAVFAHSWDTELPLSWLSEATRICRPGGAVMVFTDAKEPGTVWRAGEAVGLKPRHTFYWEKPDPPPTPRKNFASAVEVGVFFVKPGGVNTWNGGGWCRNIIRNNLAHKEQDGKTRHHPTQKPIGVMRWLVELVTNPGDLILDPFAGSGTTGVACLLSKRRSVLIEREQVYAETAKRRLLYWQTHGCDAPRMAT